MKTTLNAYINFKDNTRQAMEFYHSIFGGKLNMSTFKDYQASQDPAEENKIMHSMLETEGGLSFMAADTPSWEEYHPGSNFALALSGDNEAELTEFFNKLSAGGKTISPLEKAPWGDTFGYCVDQFGVSWMVNISPVQA